MAKRTYRRCKDCGRTREELGEYLSHSRLCGECATRRLLANIDAIHYHDGEGFTTWRRSVAASVGGVLLDDLRAIAATVGDVRLSDFDRLLDGLLVEQ